MTQVLPPSSTPQGAATHPIPELPPTPKGFVHLTTEPDDNFSNIPGRDAAVLVLAKLALYGINLYFRQGPDHPPDDAFQDVPCFALVALPPALPSEKHDLAIVHLGAVFALQGDCLPVAVKEVGGFSQIIFALQERVVSGL